MARIILPFLPSSPFLSDLKLSQLLHQLILRPAHEVEEQILLGISVLVDEPGDRVGDVAGVVADPELGLPAAPVVALGVVRVRVELLVELRDVGLV